jgi:hypothetical protein
VIRSSIDPQRISTDNYGSYHRAGPCQRSGYDPTRQYRSRNRNPRSPPDIQNSPRCGRFTVRGQAAITTKGERTAAPLQGNVAALLISGSIVPAGHNSARPSPISYLRSGSVCEITATDATSPLVPRPVSISAVNEPYENPHGCKTADAFY